MKKLFTILAVAATLVSCAKEDVVREAEGEAIQFGNAFVDNATRATDPSYSANDIDAFNVYGTVNNVLIYDYTSVTRDGKVYNSPWTCGVTQYWIPDADYKFTALVDVPKANISFDDYDMPTSFTYEANGATDVLCQTITRKNDTSLVAFNFAHLLSKVNFTVVNGAEDAEGYSFVVRNITFNGATSATYDIANKQWINLGADADTVLGNERTVKDDENNDVKVKDIVVDTGAASAELGTEVLFIPGEYTITFTVDILYNGELVTSTDYPATGSAPYTHALAANNAYNFIVNVNVGLPIQFTVEKQPTWEDGDGADDTTLLQ